MAGIFAAILLSAGSVTPAVPKISDSGDVLIEIKRPPLRSVAKSDSLTILGENIVPAAEIKDYGIRHYAYSLRKI